MTKKQESSTCALLLLPGLEGTAQLLGPFMRALPAWVKPIVVEYPREGPNGYADLLPVVRAAVPAEEPFVVMGWSFGGPLAVMLGAEAPAGLKGVVVASSFVTSPLPWLRWARPLIRAPLTPVYGWLSRTKARLWGYGDRELMALLAEVHRGLPPAGFAARIRAALGADVRQELGACRVPVLYLGASHDLLVPARCRREVSALRPDAEVEVIEGPHAALVTNAAEGARRVAGFVEKVCGEG